MVVSLTKLENCLSWFLKNLNYVKMLFMMISFFGFTQEGNKRIIRENFDEMAITNFRTYFKNVLRPGSKNSQNLFAAKS